MARQHLIMQLVLHAQNFGVAVTGPGLGTCIIYSEYEVPGCAKYNNGLYSGHYASCWAKSGAKTSKQFRPAQAHGHELAVMVQPGLAMGSH